MNNDQSRQQALARRWFIAAVGFLVLGAIFWSVDPIVIYVCFSGAVFCSAQFLFIYRKNQYHQKRTGSRRGSGTSSTDWQQWLNRTFRGKLPPHQLAGRIISITIIAFVVLFLLGIIVSDDETEGSGDGNDNLNRAREFFNSNRDSAVYYYRQAIKEDPDNVEIYVERGAIFFDNNQFDSAMFMYDKALSIDPHHSDAQYNKGLIFFLQKRYAEAIRITSDILNYDPSYYHAMLLLGDCYYDQQKLDSALRWYEDAYRQGHSESNLTHVMAYIYDTQGKTEKAIELYRETLNMDSTNVDVYNRLAELLPGEEGLWFRNRAARLSEPADW